MGVSDWRGWAAKVDWSAKGEEGVSCRLLQGDSISLPFLFSDGLLESFSCPDFEDEATG